MCFIFSEHLHSSSPPLRARCDASARRTTEDSLHSATFKTVVPRMSLNLDPHSPLFAMYVVHTDDYGDILFAAKKADRVRLYEVIRSLKELQQHNQILLVCLVDRGVVHAIALSGRHLCETPVVVGRHVMMMGNERKILVFDLEDPNMATKPRDISLPDPDSPAALTFSSLQRTHDGRVAALVASDICVMLHFVDADCRGLTSTHSLPVTPLLRPIAGGVGTWALCGDTLLLLSASCALLRVGLSANAVALCGMAPATQEAV